MKNLKLTGILIIFLLLLVISTVHAIEPLKPLCTETSPKIDGVLNDPIWQKAPYENGFKTYYPDYGAEMTEDTKVWYAYDKENLYFAFLCYDSEPDRIKTSVTARDKIRPDDWISINLDTFNDQQTCYSFYVNPQGIQMDSRAIGEDEDTDVDFVWYSEGKITEQGYSIEIKIPLKSIRFSNQEPVKMGIIFERNISRKSEMGTFPALNPQSGQNFNTQMRTIIYDGIKHSRILEILPAVTYSKNSSVEQGKLVTDREKGELSLTGKVGITSSLVLDGTYNPDFSQLEADAGQVDFNQRYALFYAEKRPFFLEGRESFFFGGSTPDDPLEAIVHTRRLVDPIAGLKLSGKIGENNTLVTIYAADELPDRQQKEEYAHFAILRYKRSLSQDSYIGGFYTGRELQNSNNRVIGTDGHIRINRSSTIGFHGLFSQSGDYEQSTRQDGHALGIKYYSITRDWYINARLHDLSENFNTETGYVTRTDVTRTKIGISRRLYPGIKIIKRIDPLLNNQFIYDKKSKQWENNNAFYLSFILPRNSLIRAGYGYAHEIFLDEKFNTSYIHLIGNSQFTKQLYFNLYYKHCNRIRYVSEPYKGFGNIASAGITYQPSQKFNSGLSLTYDDFYRESDQKKEYEYSIARFKNSYQVNKYLFFRVFLEYNSFYEELKTDLLASFTYIPGTVIHIGYGSLYDKTKWDNDRYAHSESFLETKRGFFFKTSYLWRM